MTQCADTISAGQCGVRERARTSIRGSRHRLHSCEPGKSRDGPAEASYGIAARCGMLAVEIIVYVCYIDYYLTG